MKNTANKYPIDGNCGYFAVFTGLSAALKNLLNGIKNILP